METTLRDIRYGLRMLRKNPAFTLIAVIALMLGIASTTVIFSVVNGVLLRPLPFPDADRLVYVSATERDTGEMRDAASPANYIDWAAQNDVFEHMSATRGTQGNLTEGDAPERLRATTVTASFFQVFGVNPILGRALVMTDENPGSANVMVLSHALWQRRFGGEGSVIGREIRFDGVPHTIVGVMPANFTPDEYSELWVPSPFGIPTHSLRPTQDPRQLRDSNYLDVYARLKPGVTLQQAQTQMNAIATRLEKQFPEQNREVGVALTPLQEDKVRTIRPALVVLAAAVGFLLLIGCANVANLQLARAASRAKEVSIRTALGASRSRLVRQLLTESVLLALMGGALGVVLAAWAIPLLIALAPPGLSSFKDIRLDRSVLLFTFVISVATGILFGLAPAFFVSSGSPINSLGEGERGSTASRSRGRSILIATEVGLTLVLLIAAGLMVKSFSKLMHVDPGFTAESLLIFDVGLPPASDEARHLAFYQQVVERLRGLPGVQRVGAVSRLPLSGGNSSRSFNILGSEEAHEADIRVITPDYFRTMGIPLLRGRTFTEQDSKDSARVTVINEATARDAFPGEEAVGKFITNFGLNNESLQVVGVVGNIKHMSLDAAPRSELYQPLGQAIWPRMFVAVRTQAANPLTIVPAVQSAVWSIDRNVALGSVRTMQDAIARSLLKRKFTMTLLTIFAGMAVALASIGLYGVMSYSVSQRTREIGIRMAVGAQRGDVLRLIVRQGMMLTGLGVMLGLVASFGLTRLMANLLYGVSATDAMTFVALSGLLLLVAFLACWLPARRASGVDPMVALRAE
ncbi:MAG: ABC transporter permease [Verrucomicrobiota bacterium]|nr:ABC transporter permease [Verrucomicrobiota bacterium]